MTFALSLIPISFVALGAVDFHRASTARMAVQDALDAAALRAARSGELDPVKIDQIGKTAFAANMRQLPSILSQSATFTPQADRIDAVAEVEVEPIIADLILGHAMTVRVDTEVERGVTDVEVALVLDNTGSMKTNNRIGALRDAAAQFVEIVFAGANEEDDVRVSLVPYVASVNIRSASGFDWNWMLGGGPVNRTVAAPWGSGNALELAAANAPQWTGRSFTASNANSRVNPWRLFEGLRVGWKGCVEAREAPYDVTDVAPNPAIPGTLFVPYFWPDEPTGQSNSVNSYVKNDQATSQQTKDKLWSAIQASTTKYTSSTGNLTVAANRDSAVVETGGQPTFGPNKSCGDPVLPLTGDKSVLLDRISQMKEWPGGGTITSEGLFWGWATLSPTAPFTEGRPYGQDNVRKIAVIMTDGDNLLFGGSNTGASSPGNAHWHNLSDYGAYGYLSQNRLNTTSAGTAKTRINQRMLTICDNMKAQGIEIYTIILQVPDQAAKNAFKSCATSEAHYHDVSNTSALGDVFKQIAVEIGRLRITR